MAVLSVPEVPRKPNRGWVLLTRKIGGLVAGSGARANKTSSTRHQQGGHAKGPSCHDHTLRRDTVGMFFHRRAARTASTSAGW